jgi:hypothetical protein
MIGNSRRGIVSAPDCNDLLRTVDYALLRALESQRVPVDAWTLYDRSAIDGHAFPDAPTRDAYWQSRRHMCPIRYRARLASSISAHLGPVEPLFRYDGTTRLEHDGGPDNEEIWSTVVELTPESRDHEQ